MAREIFALAGGLGAGDEQAWKGHQSALQIMRDHLRRLRVLERASADFCMRFPLIELDERRSAVQDLFHCAEDCKDEGIFRKSYRLFLSVCEKPSDFPHRYWMDLREEVRTARNRLAARMASLMVSHRETNMAS